MIEQSELVSILSTEIPNPLGYDIDSEGARINVVEEIERIAYEQKMDIITAALELAKRLDWDPAWIAPYISGSLKEKMRVEGEEQGLLKRTQHPQVLFE